MRDDLAPPRLTKAHGPLAEQPPIGIVKAAGAIVRCVAVSTALLAKRRIRQPSERVGRVMHFADGSSAPVYRETVVLGRIPAEPAVLVVEFRLRWIRGWGHTAFRLESVLNTPLFAGFPGFVSKLWLADDESGVYRGFYQWDGSSRAIAYVRALWWVLALVSVRHSIHYAVFPGLRRDDVLLDPSVLPTASSESPNWWQVARVDAPRTVAASS